MQAWRDRFRRRLGIAVAAIVASACAAAADSTSGKWMRVQSEHFTVLTPAREAVARQLAVELEQFRRGLQKVLPVPPENLQPVTVILFPNDAALRPFKPRSKGKTKEVAGLFVHVVDRHLIALSLDGDADDTRHVIFHEAVHWHAAAAERRLPLWLEEGLAEVYSTFRLKDGEKCSFGAIVPEHLALVRYRRKFDVQRTVLTTRESSDYNEGDRANIFYAQSWLMVHYLLFGEKTPGAEGIARYLGSLGHELDLENAFRSGFGAGYDEFGEKLSRYIAGGSYRVKSVTLSSRDIVATLSVRTASVAEVERNCGLLLVGTREIVTPEVLGHLQRAAELEPDDPENWQALGDVALMQPDFEAAYGYYEKAAARGSQHFRVHYGLGASRMQLAGVLPNPAENARSRADFRRALALNPRHIASYEAVAGLIYGVDDFDPADQTLLEAGMRLAPDNLSIEIGLAACDLRAGRREIGRRRLESLLQHTPNLPRDSRSYALQLLELDDWAHFGTEMAALFKQQRYAEVLAVIDQASTRFHGPRYRPSLEFNRRIAAASIKLLAAVEMINSRKPDQARHLLNEVLATDADPFSKAEARRLLAELGKE